MSSSSRVAAVIDLGDDSDDGVVMADSQMTTVDDADDDVQNVAAASPVTLVADDREGGNNRGQPIPFLRALAKELDGKLPLSSMRCARLTVGDYVFRTSNGTIIPFVLE